MLRTFLLILVAAATVAQAAPFTLEDFLQVETINSTAVSPDGKLVAWRQTHRDLEDDRYITRLWLGRGRVGRYPADHPHRRLHRRPGLAARRHPQLPARP